MTNTFINTDISFTAIDFETANSNRASACAVGLTKVRAGEVVEISTRLIRPHDQFGDFDPRNIGIHGITAADVEVAPTWDEVAPLVRDLAGDDVLLAHNVPFDRSVLNALNHAYNMDWPTPTWLDSLALAKSLLVLDSYRLPLVARALDLDMEGFEHHDPGSDAYCAAAVVLALAETTGAKHLHNLTQLADRVAAEVRKHKRACSSEGKAASRKLTAEYDYSTVGGKSLKGEVIVFTGTLPTLRRAEAKKLVKDLGAVVRDGVTRSTTVVVAGDYNQHTLRSGTNIGLKLEKALRMEKEGHQISIVTAGEFFDWIGV